MDWTQVIALFLANAGLIGWFRAESRSDWRHLDSKIDANAKETRDLINAIHSDIREEMKDFHGRLCAIEERSRGIK
jgi:hypothetical protein